MAAPGVYERFIQPVEPRLIAAAWRVLGNETDAGDALQDALANIWRHRRKLERHPNPTAWMLRVVLNASYDLIRRRRVRKTQPLETELVSKRPAPDASSLADETRLRLAGEIARLSPKQAQAVLLRLVEDLPYDAVAAALGCSEATARVHVQRGRQHLRERLADLKPSTLRSPS